MSKRLKKMPQIRGDVPYLYSPTLFYNMGITINALAQAIDFLADKVDKLEKALAEAKKED
ncbi:MAG: hypothetical protein ACI4J6_04080 [Oscillospiraceae bacterium]